MGISLIPHGSVSHHKGRRVFNKYHPRNDHLFITFCICKLSSIARRSGVPAHGKWPHPHLILPTSMYLYIYLSIYLSTYPSIYLSTYLSVYRSIYNNSIIYICIYVCMLSLFALVLSLFIYANDVRSINSGFNLPKNLFDHVDLVRGGWGGGLGIDPVLTFLYTTIIWQTTSHIHLPNYVRFTMVYPAVFLRKKQQHAVGSVSSCCSSCSLQVSHQLSTWGSKRTLSQYEPHIDQPSQNSGFLDPSEPSWLWNLNQPLRSRFEILGQHLNGLVFQGEFFKESPRFTEHIYMVSMVSWRFYLKQILWRPISENK